VKIIAIDPGTKKSGYVIYDGKKIIEHGKIINFELLSVIQKPFLKICAIEQFKNYGKSFSAGESIFEACRWSGRFEQKAQDRNLKVIYVPRKTIVTHHCGLSTRGDSKLREAILRKYPKGTKAQPLVTYGLKADAWQAFALATYVTETLQHFKA